MLCRWLPIHMGLHTWSKNITNQRLWAFRSVMVSWFWVWPTSKRWFWENSPDDHETWSTRCHVGRNPCWLCIHLAFTHTYSVGPSSVVWNEANLDRLRLFPPMRVLEVQWSRALSLVREVALNLLIQMLQLLQHPCKNCIIEPRSSIGQPSPRLHMWPGGAL